MTPVRATVAALAAGLLLLGVILYPAAPAVEEHALVERADAERVARPVQPIANHAPQRSADEGAGAPRVPDTPKFAVPPDPTRMSAAARKKLARAVVAWLAQLDRRALKTRDWDALRAAARAIGPILPAYTMAFTELLESDGGPRRALVGGLLLEAYVERGEIPTAVRDRLGRAIVPLLARTMTDERIARDERHQASRLVSRFPGDRARAELSAALDRPGDRTLRQYAAFGLAEIGGAAELPQLRERLRDERDLELSRASAMAMGRIARRDDDPSTLARVRREVEPRLVGSLATALKRDEHATFGNIAETIAELRGENVRQYLSEGLLDDARASADAKAQALLDLLAYKAVETLPALRARSGQLGGSLEPLLRRVVRSLEAMTH